MTNKKKGTVDFQVVNSYNYAEEIRNNTIISERFEPNEFVSGLELFDSNSITLDFAFAKDLRLFDIIDINCFGDDDDYGSEVISEFDDSCFIVINKEYFQRNVIYLCLYETNCNYCLEDQRLLSSGHMRIGDNGDRIMLDGMEE